MNWFSDGLGCNWETKYNDRLTGSFAGFPYSHNIEYTDKYSFNGMNFNFGIMWNINSYLTLGAVYKTPFTADLHYRETYKAQNTSLIVIADEAQEMRMPQSYGIGLACRFSDQFMMDLDVYRTDWQDYYLRQADGRELSLFTGQDRSLSDTDPTYQVRLGGEYLFILNNFVIPCRAGVFYDPEPTANKPDDFYGASLGSGIVKGSFAWDVAYQFRWGNDVRKVRLGTEEVGQDVEQHTIYTSLIYYF